MATAVESWDDDIDIQGDFQGFGNSVGTAQTSLSSRLSTFSESIAGDDDWNVVLQPNNESSTQSAIQSAKQAGIPLPSNIPSSALLGGSIKRLGKKSSRQKIDDDWDNDLDMGDAPLTLKPRAGKTQLPPPTDTTTFDDDLDDFDDLEGSLGIRFAGTRRDARDSSISGMSPSLAGSIMAESDHDEGAGLEFPEEPLDFEAMLKKRRAAEAELSDLSQASPGPVIEQPATVNNHKKSKLLSDDSDDFLNDLDLGGNDNLNIQKRTVNRNIKIKNVKPSLPAPRPSTTLNFHDKPTDKPTHLRSHLPRPVSMSKNTSRLEPVLESSGASHNPRERRQAPTTSGPPMLRSKRSMPALRSQPSAPPQQKPSIPFLSSGTNLQSQHASAQRAMPYHLRRDSDPNNRQGAQSPPMRSHSRLSNLFTPDTPSRLNRQRSDLAPAALAREAASKRTLTKPARRRNFGDGSELEIFDDLPTSISKESKFTKQPSARGPPKLGLRHTQSRPDMREPAKRNLALPDRMMTPAPPKTPASPTKGFGDVQNHTPSYLRDTAASRIARETRLANNNPRPRSEGPLQPLSTNWKAQIAARSPLNSPSAQKQKGKRSLPHLIQGMGAHVAKTEKGMIYNPHTLRWEGNENTLAHFDIPPPLETPTPIGGQPQTSYMGRHHGPPASPPRPALIAPMSTTANLQVNGGMVFDPHQMKWLKMKHGRDVSGQLSPSATDEDEDVFAGLDDLKESTPGIPIPGVGGMASPVSMAANESSEVHEEFDLGPQFIRLQKDEELSWRRRCDLWFYDGEPRQDDGRWRWAIRDIASPEGF